LAKGYTVMSVANRCCNDPWRKLGGGGASTAKKTAKDKKREILGKEEY
jgi:hypothetical protein